MDAARNGIKRLANQISQLFGLLGRRTADLIKTRHLKDPFLIAAVAIGILLASPGFKWGEYDCLNLDAMAFNNIFAGDRRPFEPNSYVKPPLYTYMCHFVARVPAMALVNVYFFKERHERYELFLRLRTAFARCLNMAFFALCTAAIFTLAHSFYSLFTARISAILFATSCGFIPYQIFLTTDLAVIFVMLASFLFAVKILKSPSMFNSVAAGLLAGLACSTKYNGIAVAVALPIAHLLAGGSGNLLLKALKRKSAWVCGACVPLGVIFGNPYMLINWNKFNSDFVYNYTVTPVYDGVTSGNGYAKYFQSFYEIFGIPGSILILISIITGFFWIIFTKTKPKPWQLWLLALSVFILYSYKIGSFPRIETRFVLPAAPFALIIAFAGFEALRKITWALIPAWAAVILFNLSSGFYVSKLFADDPRNLAIDYYKSQLKQGAVMEFSESLPYPHALPFKVKSFKMRSGLERLNLFEEIFHQNEAILSMLDKKENQTTPEWFSMKERKKRGTDFVIWSSIDIEGIVRPHYEALFDPANGYKVIYDASSPEVPDWVYPKHTEFLRNRTTIWIENWKPENSKKLIN
jgi:hypothetical protein